MTKKVFVILMALVVLASLLGLAAYKAPALYAQVANPTATPMAALPNATAGGQAAPAPQAIAAYEGALEKIYSQVDPSVVNIRVVEQVNSPGTASPDNPNTPFFGPFGPQVPQFQQGLGSGFVWDKQGDIVTNNHVVDGANSIEVTFSDGSTVPATVVGRDVNSDLAVVKVDVPAGKLQPVQVADSTQLRVGQLVVAIGNPFGLQGTMTTGIVSALGRSLPVNGDNSAQSPNGPGATFAIPDIIQTDAAINPGNSGGVLTDDSGQLIGVTAAIFSTGGSSAGIGFAIPSAIVQKVVPVLIQSGHFEWPFLGISGTNLTPDIAQAMNLPSDQRGALVVDVVPGGPADKAGLHASDQQVTVNGEQLPAGGDVITAIDGTPVNTFDDLVTYQTDKTKVGQTVTLTVLRDGKKQTLQVTLAARPDQTAAGQQAAAGQPATPGAQPTAAPASSRRIGILGTTLTPEIAQAMNLEFGQQGVLVERVQQGSPAGQAGLRGSSRVVTIGGQQVEVGGDIITAADGTPVATVQDLQTILSQATPNSDINLDLLRDGEPVTVTVHLGQNGSNNQ